MKKIALLGSTGSIGLNVLRVVREFPSEFSVTALAAGRYSETLAAQIKEFRPRMVCVADDSSLPSSTPRGVEFLSGHDGLKFIAASDSAELVFIAVVGAVGIFPLVEAVRRSKTVALANKESVVIAGDYIKRRLGISGGLAKFPRPGIIPVDSEHSAIFQCLEGRRIEDVARLIITASGGALYGSKKRNAAVKDVLRHPTWKMGKKITVDSATLMNKGLEVIEAHFLFGVPYSRISTLIHPQSIVHSMVEFVDGSVLAQLSPTDMRYAIHYALNCPSRKKSPLAPLELDKIGKLEFSNPDFSAFPCFGLAVDAGKAGGIMPAVMNAANEVAVGAFLEEKISFAAIAAVIEKTMSAFRNIRVPSLEDIISADSAARRKALECIK